MRLSTSALCVGHRLRTTNRTAGICIGCERLGPVGMLPAAYRRADGSFDCPNRICIGRELTQADEAAAMADEATHGADGQQDVARAESHGQQSVDSTSSAEAGLAA